MNLRAIIVRVLILVAIVIAFGLLNSRFWQDQDKIVGANIGAGIGFFIVLFVVSAVLGLLDGRRAAKLSPVVLGWVGIAIVVACVEVLRLAIASEEPFGTALGLYADTWPFIVGLIAIPGAVGATTGQLFRRADG